jgi:hypothetical protein
MWSQSKNNIHMCIIGEKEDIISAFLDNAETQQEMNDVFIAQRQWIRKAIIIQQHINRVGFYQKTLDNETIRIIIVPKTIEPPTHQSSLEYIQACMKHSKDYLSRHLNYASSQTKSQLSLDMNPWDELSSQLLKYYENILHKLFQCVKTYTIQIQHQKKFSSAVVSGQIDIYRNITAFDKSRIHQKKTVYQYDTEVIRITLGVLQMFLQKQLNHCQTKEADFVRKQTKNIRRYINRRFQTRTKSFSLFQLLSSNTKSAFQRNAILKRWYSQLCNLFMAVDFSSEHLEADGYGLLLQGSTVYERLLEHQSRSRFTNTYVKGKMPQQLHYIEQHHTFTSHNPVKTLKKNAEPDIIIHLDSIYFVIDLKWKILKSTEQVSAADTLKLLRDRRVLQHYCEKSDLPFEQIIPILLFPKITSSHSQSFIHSYEEDIRVFIVEHNWYETPDTLSRKLRGLKSL